MGREKESEALSAYKDIVSNPQNHGKHVCINKVHFHQDFEIVDLGLVLKVDELWFRASPDSCVRSSCCGHGVVEIKCPYKYREDSLKNAVVSRNLLEVYFR